MGVRKQGNSLMKLPLAYYGDPILRKKSERINVIDDELRQLIDDMFETMFANNGMGLAAIQVFKPIALFITCIPRLKADSYDEWEHGPLKVYINPKLSNPGEECDIHSEGCLSIPKVNGNVLRPTSITVEATDLEGKQFIEHLTDTEARCVMHENDHTNGILYIDRMIAKERQFLEQRLKENKKKSKK